MPAAGKRPYAPQIGGQVSDDRWWSDDLPVVVWKGVPMNRASSGTHGPRFRHHHRNVVAP